jgi:hypothetical protein
MGEAKRRREVGDRVSWCRTCTLCCTLPEIQSLKKPSYKPCHHLKDQGCGIFGQPERPAVCTTFQCAYLNARTTDAETQNRIPHPLDAGAYFNVDPGEKLIVLFVDPASPQQWKHSAIVDYLRPLIARGFSLEVIDRGRRMTIAAPALFEATLARDYVAYADRQGWARDIPSFDDYSG